MIIASICLSDIPKDKITTSEKNGKKYISLKIDTKKETDMYGNTHSVAINPTKEEREKKVPTVYVGNGKEFHFSNVNGTSFQGSTTPSNLDKPSDGNDGSNMPF